jgi:hypothetical protein
MDPVGVDQSKAPCGIRLGTPLTIMPQSDGGVLQDAREVVFLEKKIFYVPNQSPMRRHRAVLVQPALGTQEFGLQTVITSHLPHAFIDATTAAGEEEGVVVEGEEYLQEDGFLGLQFVHMCYSLHTN